MGQYFNTKLLQYRRYIVEFSFGYSTAKDKNGAFRHRRFQGVEDFFRVVLQVAFIYVRDSPATGVPRLERKYWIVVFANHAVECPWEPVQIRY